MLIYVDICSSSTRSNKKSGHLHLHPIHPPTSSPSRWCTHPIRSLRPTGPPPSPIPARRPERGSRSSMSEIHQWNSEKKNADGSPGDPRFFFNKKSLVFMDVLGIWMFLIDHPSLTWHLTPNSAPWARHSSKKECLCDSLSKSLWKTSSPHGHGPCHATDVGHVRFSTGPWTWWKSSWQNGSSRLFDFEMTWSSDLKASQLTCRTDTAAGGP